MKEVFGQKGSSKTGTSGGRGRSSKGNVSLERATRPESKENEKRGRTVICGKGTQVQNEAGGQLFCHYSR